MGPAARLVRFVTVVHPTRGSCLLMCTDTSLDAIQIIRLMWTAPVVKRFLAISCARVLRNVRALDRRSSHIPDVAGHATRQAADDASLVVRALPSMRVAQMQAAHAAGGYARRKGRSAFDGSPGSGAPLCPTCDAALEPLAIMGVRLRVRHQSLRRARGHRDESGIA